MSLGKDQAHYLFNVLRKTSGDIIRLFESSSGEWLARIESIDKKSVSILPFEQLREPKLQKHETHLLFAPIKKNRLDFLIEKSVELGVTHLHPIITEHTEVRKLNIERLQSQIIEAAEQCERLTLPELSPIQPAIQKIDQWPQDISLFAAIERDETAEYIGDVKIPEKRGFIIGPEGGFSDKEIAFMQNLSKITAISLGDSILRAETATLKILSVII